MTSFQGTHSAHNETLYNETAGNSSRFPFVGDLVPNGTMDEYIFDSRAVRIFFYTVYTVVFCLCFFGNLLVLLVVGLHWRMRSITKFCIGNLAFANFCVGVFCIYQNLSTFLSENWGFGRVLCKMYYFTTSMSHTASILILVVICVERYLSIINPFRGRRILTIQRLRLVLVAVWLISGIICAPRLYYITTFKAPLLTGMEEDYEVICAPKRTLYNSRTADMVYFVLLFIIPLIIMSILYARIGAVIWKTSAVLQSATEPKETASVPLVSSSSHNEQFPRPPNNSSATSSSVKKRSNSNGDSCSGSSSSRGVKVNLTRARCTLRSEESLVQNLHRHLYHENEVSVNPAVVDHLSHHHVTHHRHHSARSSATVSTRQLIQVKDERRGKVLRSRQAVIRMLIVLVSSFALCNFPYHLRKICQYYLPNYNVQGYFNQIFTPLTFLLMYTNCAINPILYAFMSKNFRKSLREFLKFKSKHTTRTKVRNRYQQRRLSV